MSPTRKPSFFDNEDLGIIYSKIKEHFNQYDKTIPVVTLENGVDESKRQDMVEMIKEIKEIDYDISENYEFLLNEVNLYMKEKAYKDAL